MEETSYICDDAGPCDIAALRHSLGDAMDSGDENDEGESQDEDEENAEDQKVGMDRQVLQMAPDGGFV